MLPYSHPKGKSLLTEKTKMILDEETTMTEDTAAVAGGDEETGTGEGAGEQNEEQAA